MAKLEAEYVAPWFKISEKLLTENGTGYFVSDTITWADLFIFETLHDLKGKAQHLYEENPKMKEFVDKLINEPKIHAWLENV